MRLPRKSADDSGAVESAETHRTPDRAPRDVAQPQTSKVGDLVERANHDVRVNLRLAWPARDERVHGKVEPGLLNHNAVSFFDIVCSIPSKHTRSLTLVGKLKKLTLHKFRHQSHPRQARPQNLFNL